MKGSNFSCRSLVVLAAIAAIGVALTDASFAQTAAQSAAIRQKAVFQVSDADPQKWNLALNNVKNVQDDLGASAVDLEIVVYGPGIGMLKLESPVAARVAEATKNGIKVVACENTMKGQKLTRADMLPDIAYVQAGVVELMMRQREGYAYIRP